MNVAKLGKVARTGAKWFGVTVITAIVTSLVTALMEGKDLKGLRESIPVLWRAFLEPVIPVWIFVLVVVIAVAGLPKLLRRKRTTIDLRTVVGDSAHNVWTIGANGSEPILNLTFAVSFAHREPNMSLILKKIYLEGTESVLSLHEIVVPGLYGREEIIHLMLRPVIAKPGKALKGRVVFVDQF